VTEKPQTFNGDLANLPPAAALGRLVVGVPPRQARDPSRFARSNDPSTWGGYTDAVAAVAAGKADGIGYMLSTSNIGAGDLDHCVNPTTGILDPWATKLEAEANGAYREITVSGQGLRIIGIANGPEIHTRFTLDHETGAGLELYRNTARYITISGREIGHCVELPPFDRFIDTLLTRYAGKPRKKTRNGNGAGAKHDFNEAGQQSSSIDYDKVIRNGAPNGQRSELFQACVWHLAARGLSLEQIIIELEQYPHGIGEKYVGRLREEVERSYEKWRAERRPAAADTEPDEAQEWDEVDKHGDPKPTCTNARRALRALGIQCRYDVFHDKLLVESPIVKRRDNIDQTVQILRVKIHKAYGFDSGMQNTYDALVQLCLENEFDPVLDYLNALQWDGVPRLDHWLATYMGANDTELNREFGRLALIAAGRRVRSPGCKFDPILVLEGPMGTNKSKAIEILAGVENFSDQSIFGARDREQQELLAGIWLYEIAELSNIRKTEVEHIKAFASRTHDRARPAYGRTRIDQPRRCVLFATTNNDRYLKEADRRFWPLKTKEIDIEALKRDRDQLWAEAALREQEGTSIVLRRELWNAARVEQEAREEHDPWDDILVDAIGTIEQEQERVFSRDLLETVLGFQKSRMLDRDSKRLVRCMRRLGWVGPKVIRIGNKLASGYYREMQTRTGE
jgi:Virulence-associated protein E